MQIKRSVTHHAAEALPWRERAAGPLLGATGVLVFSFSLPATKLALHGFAPWFVAFGRAALASGAAAAVLLAQRARRPSRSELGRLGVVAAGVVFGFPVLTSLALRSTGAGQDAVVVGLLPAATAVIGALRAGETPSPAFWLAATAGTATVTGYALARSHGSLRASDLFLLAAVMLCAVGYAEGGLLARTLGAPRTICWALVLSAPVSIPLAVLSAPAHVPALRATIGFLYTSAGSMFLGFFAWYAGLARGGVARISQIQLGQTPLTLGWSALVLGERIGTGTIEVAGAVLLSVAVTQRARVRARVPASVRPCADAVEPSGSP